MPFIIVETIEKGSKQLSICPEQWVTDGILNWPNKKSSKKSKIESLTPNEKWLQMQCIIKRSNLDTYESAETELNAMVNTPETDHEDINNAVSAKFMIENFNHVAEQLSSNTNQSLNTSTIAEHSIDAACETTDLVENYIMVPNHNDTAPGSIHAAINPIQEATTNDELHQNQKILFDNQIKILDNQFKIMKTLATISVKIDKLASNSEMPIKIVEVKELSNDMKKNPLYNKVSPIKNIDDLQRMETQLRDAETRKYYLNLYSVFCTPGKKGEGCAFQLIDVFFTREFLVQCSWSGCSRGEGTKISIKIFREVLGFFFELVHSCDPSYTMDKNNDFFKAIVKNAYKRTQCKLSRTSAPRNVPKRKLPNSQNESIKKFKETIEVIEEDRNEEKGDKVNSNLDNTYENENANKREDKENEEPDDK